MTTLAGKVVNVYTRAAGANVAEAFAIGSTYVSVDSAYPFEEEGGTVAINGVEFNYSGIQFSVPVVNESFDEVDRLVLIGTATVAGEVDDFVSTYPASTYRLCQVQLPDSDEGVQAVIPFAMSAIFANDGIREDEAQESVYISDEEGRWVVTAADEEEAIVSGFRVSPDGLPAAGTDGLPPAAMPTLFAQPGVKSIYYRWNSLTNADPLTYKLFARRDELPTTTDDTYLVADGDVRQAVVKKIMGPSPDNPLVEALGDITDQYDYYAILLAEDDDGRSPESIPISSRGVLITGPDIAVESITGDKILGREITADHFESRMTLTSSVAVGEKDYNGLDPMTMQPNLLAPLTDENLIVQIDFPTDGTKWSIQNASSWTVESEQFVPVNDDPYWKRMAAGSLQALRLKPPADLSGSSQGIGLKTVLTVEPLTEYRFEFNSSCPGADPNMPGTGLANHDVNTVKWFFSPDTAISSSEVASWKTFPLETTPRPDLTKFDKGIIRTGTGQTTLYVYGQIFGDYMKAANGGFLIVFPELRKLETSTTVPAVPVAPASVSATDVTASATNTNWQASAVWSGTTSSIVRTPSTYTVIASASFSPSEFSTPGRYAIPGEAQSFLQAKGVRITTQSAGTGLGLRARIIAPAQSVPTLAVDEYAYVSIGLSGLTQSASGLDDLVFIASWFDGSNTLITNETLMDLDAAGLVAQGITNLTENYFDLPLNPPSGATTVVFWAEFSNGPAGNITASTNQTPGIHGLRFYTLHQINYNYGSVSPRHVDIDSAGVRLVNEQAQVQVNIPTDSAEIPFFKGGGEFQSLRVIGGASFEGQSEIAKDSTFSLSDGIKSPVNIPTITQEWEQYTLQRQPPDGQFPGFSTKPTLNPAQITGMVWKSEWNEMWIMEDRGGGSALWRFTKSGTCLWVGLQSGWASAVPFEDTRTTPGVNDSLYAGKYGGNWWALVYTGSARIFNQIPAGVIPTNSTPTFSWNQTNNKLYVWYPHVDGSSRNVYKRLGVNNTDGGDMTLEDTVVSGSGTSRSSTSGGLAGAVIIGSILYTVARNVSSVDTYVFNAGAGGAILTGSRWPVASPPMGFTLEGTAFWQVDTAGKFTRYSSWTWSETNHKLYAGMTWYDSDTAGTGIHETDLTVMASATLKKRIANIRITMPQVPDKGGTDDPNKWRLYAAKAASLTLPANRTSMFLQADGGSPSAQTTYVIPANGLVTTGTNPPAANNFPSAGPGRLYSAASDAFGAINDINGAGFSRMGPHKVLAASPTILRATDDGPLFITYFAESSVTTSIPNGGSSPYTTVTGWSSVAGAQLYTSQSAGSFTMLYAGCYDLELGLGYGNTADAGRAGIILFKNGAEYRRYLPGSGGANTHVDHLFKISAAVNDIFIVKAFQNTGAAANLAGTHIFNITRTSRTVN